MQLSQRERGLILAGVLAIALVVGYLYVWNPLVAKRLQLQQEIKRDQQTLKWLSRADQQIEQLRRAGVKLPSPRSEAVLVIVERLLKQRHLNPYVTQVQQSNAKTVVLKLQDVPFDQFVQWLILLWREQQLRVQSLSLQRSVTEGTVSVTVTLSTQVAAQ